MVILIYNALTIFAFKLFGTTLSDGKPIFSHSLSDKGVIMVNELLSENLQLFDWNQANKVYSLTDRDFMKFAGITQSISSAWKREISRCQCMKKKSELIIRSSTTF